MLACLLKNYTALEKEKSTEWEKVFATHVSDKGLLFIIYEKLIELNKNTKLIKMDNVISPKKMYKNLFIHENMPNIITC